MPGEIITLKANGVADLLITGDLRLAMDPDWGDQTIETSLATGPDVIGGVIGTRTRTTRSVTLPIQIHSDNADDYIAAAISLETAASALALSGGTITRQVDFGGGDMSEELELEVLECDISPEGGWMQAHRTFSTVTLSLVTNPVWLAVEETLGQTLASTDSVILVNVTAPRGSVPGPGRVVITDQDTTARRFVELGGAFLQDDQQVEFLSGDFSLTGTDAVYGSDADAISAHKLTIDPLIAAWRTMGYLNNLDHRGGYRVRARVKGGSDDADAIFRVAWRSGDGPWVANPGTTLTESGDTYFDIDLGPIDFYPGGDTFTTIDVRIDVRGSDTDTGALARLDLITITPAADLYAVGQGVVVEEPASDLAVFDGWDHDNGDALNTVTAPVGPGGFDDWDEIHDTDLVPHWSVDTGLLSVIRTISGDDADMVSGQFGVVGDPSATASYISTPSLSATFYGSPDPGDEVRTGLVARFSETTPGDHDNWLMLAIRSRKLHNSRSYHLTLYKSVSGSVDAISEKKWKAGSVANAFLNVDDDGIVSFGCKGFARTLDADADLATSGDLEAGLVGVYSAANNQGVSLVGEFSCLAAGTISTQTEVVRRNGIGVFNSTNSFAADDDGSDPVEFTPQGRRIIIPPYSGVVSAKVRHSNSELDPDLGWDHSTDVQVYSRAAFTTLSDALE